MARNVTPSPPVDLEILDTYSDVGKRPAKRHGPVRHRWLPHRSDWMPLVWGGDEPEFDTVDAADAVLGTIMARYNEIIACLDGDPESFNPVFLNGPEEQVIVTDWAAGFMDAVILRQKAWAPILEDEDGHALMLPLLVLGSDDDQPLFDAAPLPEENVEKLLADGADTIMEAVIAIYEFWQGRRT
jgi:uncharacterized protein